MKQTDEQMKDEIMRRVQTVRLMRTMFNPAALKSATLAVSLALVFSLVSVQNVIANISSLGGISVRLQYVASSFTETSLGVQLGIMIALVSSVWLAVDIARNLKGSMRREVSLG